MKLKTRLLGILIAVAIIPLLISHYIFSYIEKETVEADFIAHLDSIASIQHSRIRQYFANEFKSYALIASRTKLRTTLHQYNSTGDKQLKLPIRTILNDAKRSVSTINNIYIYDFNQRLIVGTNSTITKESERLPEKILENINLKPKINFIRDINGKLLINLQGYLFYDNAPLGILIVEISSKDLLLTLNDYTGLGDTGETVLAGRNQNGDAEFLTPTRHDQNSALNIIISRDNESVPIIHAMNGKSEVLKSYLDYRNTPVLAVSRYIPETDWGMIVKIDLDEAYRSIGAMQKPLFIIVSVSCLIILLTAWIVAERLVTPLKKLEKTALQIKNGNFALRADESGDKELQHLAQAFNAMTSSFVQSQEQLNESLSLLSHQHEKLTAETARFERWKQANFIGIVQSNAHGQIIEANQVMLEMLGYQESDLGQLNWRALTPEEYSVLDAKAIEEANEKGYWTPFEKEYYHKDGHRVPVLIGGSIFEHNRQEFIVFVVDLSERHLKQQQLLKYEEIVCGSSDLLAFVSKEYIYQTVNPAYLKMHGLESCDVVGKTVSEVLGTDVFLERIKPHFDLCLSGQKAEFKVWLSFKAAGRRYLDCSYIPYTNKKGEVEGIVLQGSDITDSYKQQLLLQAAQDEKSKIIDAMLEGLLTINEDGVILSFNKAAESIFGYRDTEVLTKNITMLMPTNDALHHASYIRHYIKTGHGSIIGKPEGRELHAKHKSGQIFPIRLSVAELKTKDGEKRRFIGTCQDLTENKRQKDLLLRGLKMESLGKLTGGIAHDFNNILGIISGYNDLMLKKHNDDFSINKYLQAIEKACLRGNKLTRNLLTFARKESSDAAELSINGVLKKNQDMIERILTSKVKLSLDLEPNLFSILIDEALFEDMLINMSINAMHAMPDGGDFRISTENVHSISIGSQFGKIPEGDYIKLTFIDNGCGMNEEVKAKIFDPFFTTKDDIGSGLGLSQCYGFIKSSNGYIDVESTEWIGTTFSIFLPRYLGKAEELKRAKAEQVKKDYLPGENQKVLVVDDEHHICDIYQEYLKIAGFDVRVAYSAKEAIEQASKETFSLIISDVIMPEMSGVDLYQTLREEQPKLPFLFVSGYVGNDNESKLPDDVKVLKKPCSSEVLLKAVNEILANKTSEEHELH
ncbi:PAS domain S-box protein [Catenovulum sp. SM1970]|uniref:PAS domain S-box protein n=1 Tax=Marinifaba aquimaris TaxID=2741323 RepID=UPI00157229C5|nr:PAS domain S-box protein [Marinifaba aquimaris]NTS77194.1 PAS domain S-box protein [Marinifaba aquimaris]